MLCSLAGICNAAAPGFWNATVKNTVCAMRSFQRLADDIEKMADVLNLMSHTSSRQEAIKAFDHAAESAYYNFGFSVKSYALQRYSGEEILHEGMLFELECHHAKWADAYESDPTMWDIAQQYLEYHYCLLREISVPPRQWIESSSHDKKAPRPTSEDNILLNRLSRERYKQAQELAKTMKSKPWQTHLEEWEEGSQYNPHKGMGFQSYKEIVSQKTWTITKQLSYSSLFPKNAESQLPKVETLPKHGSRRSYSRKSNSFNFDAVNVSEQKKAFAFYANQRKRSREQHGPAKRQTKANSKRERRPSAPSQRKRSRHSRTRTPASEGDIFKTAFKVARRHDNTKLKNLLDKLLDDSGQLTPKAREFLREEVLIELFSERGTPSSRQTSAAVERIFACDELLPDQKTEWINAVYDS